MKILLPDAMQADDRPRIRSIVVFDPWPFAVTTIDVPTDKVFGSRGIERVGSAALMSGNWSALAEMDSGTRHIVVHRDFIINFIDHFGWAT
jgi:hypothetical protein